MPRRPSIGRTLAYGVFGVWLLATALAQDPTRRSSLIRNLDPTGACIPDWRFFAPRPAMHDYHLLARDELSDGSLTGWTEVYQAARRSLAHAVWCPRRRAEKAISDAVSGLISFFADPSRRPEDVQLTAGYLTILNYVSNRVAHPPGATRTQFLVALSAGYEPSEEPGLLFLSNRHRLSRD